MEAIEINDKVEIAIPKSKVLEILNEYFKNNHKVDLKEVHFNVGVDPNDDDDRYPSRQVFRNITAIGKRI